MGGWGEALICDPHASMGPTVRASREDAAKLRNWLTAWLGEDTGLPHVSTATTLAELDRMAVERGAKITRYNATGGLVRYRRSRSHRAMSGYARGCRAVGE